MIYKDGPPAHGGSLCLAVVTEADAALLIRDGVILDYCLLRTWYPRASPTGQRADPSAGTAGRWCKQHGLVIQVWLKGSHLSKHRAKD